jgi:hypothetical protein
LYPNARGEPLKIPGHERGNKASNRDERRLGAVVRYNLDKSWVIGQNWSVCPFLARRHRQILGGWFLKSYGTKRVVGNLVCKVFRVIASNVSLRFLLTIEAG